MPFDLIESNGALKLFVDLWSSARATHSKCLNAPLDAAHTKNQRIRGKDYLVS
jgi:hypothetical protein